MGAAILAVYLGSFYTNPDTKDAVSVKTACLMVFRLFFIFKQMILQSHDSDGNQAASFGIELNISQVKPDTCLIVCLGLFLLSFVEFIQRMFIVGFFKKKHFFINARSLDCLCFVLYCKTHAFKKNIFSNRNH